MWQPIETAPREIDVLCYLDRGRPPVVAGYFKDSGGWYTYDEPYTRLWPTHWMPLPPPPDM